MKKVTGTAASAAQAVSKAIFGDNTTDREGGDVSGQTQRAGENAASVRRGDSLAFDSSDGSGSRTAVSEPASKSPVLGAPQPSPAFGGAGACGSRFQSGIPVANTTAAATIQAEMPPGDDRTAGERGSAVLGRGRDDPSTGLMASEKLERHLHDERGIRPNAADPTISDGPQTTTSSLPGSDPDGSSTGDEQSGMNEWHTTRLESEHALNAGPGGDGGTGAVDGQNLDNSGHSQLWMGATKSGEAVSGGSGSPSDAGGLPSIDAPPAASYTELKTGTSPPGSGLGSGDRFAVDTGTEAGMGAHPASGVTAQHPYQQGSEQPMAQPAAAEADSGGGGGGGGVEAQQPPQLSNPPVEGQSDGPLPHEEGNQLHSASGTGQGNGTQYVRSTGMAAEGGDFDAAAPGAGREAE